MIIKIRFLIPLIITFCLNIWSHKATSEPEVPEQPSSEFTQGLFSVIENAFPDDFSGALLVAHGDKIILSKGFGYSNKSEQVRFSERTVVDVGSITKQFTGAAILKLEMQGKLSTDDKLSKYIPLLGKHLSDITLHELLTHTSGITDETGDDYDEITKDKLIARLNSAPLSFPKGSHNYSNIGYSLLALVVENISDQSFDEFLNVSFFKPIGMMQTGYVVPEFADSHVAHGYQGVKDWGRPNAKNWQSDGPYWNLRGNGGILSTAHDMYLWHLALQTQSVLSKSAKVKLFGKHAREFPNTESYYGYGWVIEEFEDGEKMIWHNGGNGIFSADFRSYPDKSIFYFIAGNHSDNQVWEISERLHKYIRK